MKEVLINDQNRYLEFELGGELFAIPLSRVREVIAVPKTTRVPDAPAHFVGLMNLRGQVLSVLDLKKKLSIKSVDGVTEPAVIILDIEPNPIGVIVDSVHRVLNISQKDLSDPPTNSEKAKGLNYVDGIFKGDNRLTLIISVEKIIDVSDIQRATAAKTA